MLNAAVEHHKADRLAEAQTLYRQILSQRPNQPDTLHLLGLLASRAGRSDAAADLIRRAIAIHPDVPDYQANLGMIVFTLRQIDEAGKF
jgi:Flp pilus assembly protein TadD